MAGLRARGLRRIMSPTRGLTAIVIACGLSCALAACSGSHHQADAAGSSGSSTSSSPSVTGTTTSKAGPTVAAPTTAVSAPSVGSIHSTVASASVHTDAPLPVSATADFGTGLTARVTANQKISFSAQLPGEVSGPAAKVTIQFVNNSAAAISLANVVVNDEDAKAVPCTAVQSSPNAPVSGSLAPGKSATGVYVFELPTSYVAPLTVSVSYTTAAPVVLFVGDLS